MPDQAEWEFKRAGVRARFRAEQHPRDSKGRFIEVGARVRILRGGTGRVVGFGGPGRVLVERDLDKQRKSLPAGWLTVEDGPAEERVRQSDLAGMSDEDLVHGLRTAPTPDQAAPLRDEMTRRAAVRADKILGEVGTVEPEVTRDLGRSVAGFGGRMEGLKNRVKGRDSLVRKIRDKTLLSGRSMDEVAGRINDALRYTAVVDEKGYVPAIERVIGDYRRRGYTVVDNDNTWHAGNPYQGINMVFASPEGVQFELQFHTAASYRTKSGNHRDYELMRDPGASLEERQAAYRRMVDTWKKVPTPPGVERIGDERRYGMPVKAAGRPRFFTLRLPGDREPYGVAKLDDGIPYLFVPGRGWVDMPAIADYFFNGEPGAGEVDEAEAQRLMRQGVGPEWGRGVEGLLAGGDASASE